MQHAARFYKVKNYSDRELQREKLKQADFIQPMRGSRIFPRGRGGGVARNINVYRGDLLSVLHFFLTKH